MDLIYETNSNKISVKNTRQIKGYIYKTKRLAL